jgi:hypothetical protein
MLTKVRAFSARGFAFIGVEIIGTPAERHAGSEFSAALKSGRITSRAAAILKVFAPGPCEPVHL